MLDRATQNKLEAAANQAVESLKPRGWFPALLTYEDGKVWLEMYWEPPQQPPINPPTPN
jgi:hypothetical protein